MGRFDETEKSAAAIRAQAGDFVPEVAMVLGSGLGFLADEVQQAQAIDYALIPGFAPSTAPGHSGRLVLGWLAGKKVAVMQGRVHYYEGVDYGRIVFPLQALGRLGAKKLIITNAAGGVDESFSPGQLMLLTDHIKFFDESPLRGPNDDRIGTRFPDMSYAYSPPLREKAKAAARKQGLTLREGVYMYFPGPQYETPAEIRAARLLGASAVGMSTVPEVIAAVHAGMQVLGLSLITNMAAGILPKPLTEKEVLDAAAAAKERFGGLIKALLPEI